MLERLRSAIYGAPDLASAKAFYSALLGKAPSFDQPFYVGFDVSGFELGLSPGAPPVTLSCAYWRVAALEPALARAVELGGQRVSEPRDVGGGIRMAVVADPCGNHLGFITEEAA